MSTRYMNGLEYMKTTPGVMERLFELIYSSSVNVSRQATALVFIVCQFLEDGTVEYVELTSVLYIACLRIYCVT